MGSFDAFTHYAKNTIILAQEEMEKCKDVQLRTHHLLQGILRQPKCLAATVLRNFGVTYENVDTMIQQSKNWKTPAEKNDQREEVSVLSLLAQQAIENAAKLAAEFQHPMVDSEHLLYALLKQENSEVLQIMEQLMVRPKQILDYLDHIFGSGSSAQKTADQSDTASATISGTAHDGPLNANHVENLLNGLQGFLMQMTEQRRDEDRPDTVMNDNNLTDKKSEKKSKTIALDYFCTDFTDLAIRGKLEKVVGRQKEISRITHILSRKTKNNPLLLGEPGTGKTAVVEGLAQKIAEGNAPGSLLDKRVLSLSITHLIAGTKYRGEFEDRIKRIIDEASDEENSIILFIDELHTIIGAGSAEGTLDAANILKPALSRGNIQIIGATTNDEYQKYIEKDKALSRRFQAIDMSEPSVDEAIEIIQGVKPSYENFHCVRVCDEAISAAVKLSHRYITDRFLPDKAFDLLDEACASKSVGGQADGKEVHKQRLKLSAIRRRKENAVSGQNYEQANLLHQQEVEIEQNIQQLKLKNMHDRSVQDVSAEDIARVLQTVTNIPVSTLLASEISALKNLESAIGQKIVGQNEAIKTIATAIRRTRVGLQNPDRPLGAFLFLGPTGVGKTEIVRTLAKEIYHDEKALIKIDMSEFASGHTSSRLVGASAGYVGYEQGGDLTEKIRKKPYSIVLFDEIEKAHKEVHNLLLQILEDGTLTDGKGRKVSFKNAIIVLTSNIGATRFQKEANAIGFSDGSKTLQDHEKEYESVKTEVLKDLRKTLSPEFISRLDSVVVFRPLDKSSIKKIVQHQIDELQERLNPKNIMLQLPDSVINALAKHSYAPESGAREVRRVVQNRVETPLVEMFLSAEIPEKSVITGKYDTKKNICTFSVASKGTEGNNKNTRKITSSK